jgi:hypothetical protein
MGKTFKKKDLKEYIDEEELLDEEDLNELIDIDGGLISHKDNYKATDKVVKSKGTSKDHARRTSQGPGAYYPWGGAFYGGYYTMNEEDDVLEEEDVDVKEEIDDIAESRMKELVDEMLSKKKQYGIVKRTNEQDVVEDVTIPEFGELKSKYDNPIVARKLMYLTDLINKHDVSGDEIAIIFNHLIDNLEIAKLRDEYKKILCDKLAYGGEEEE